MKSNTFLLLLSAVVSPMAEAQTAQNFPYGITLGNPVDTYIDSWAAGGGRTSSEFTSASGGLVLYAELKETAPGYLDGGITLYGNPISMVPFSAPNYNSGTFDVWRASDYGSPMNQPVFRVDTAANTASFNSLAVSITSGTLTVAGNPVLTTATAGSYLDGQGYIHSSGFGQLLSSATPPSSAAWTAAYVPRGNVTNGGYQSYGSAATASNLYSTAIGEAVVASGSYSTATGQNSTASSTFSLALGYYSTASGYASFARGSSAIAAGYASTSMGWGTSAKARTETALGNYNVESNPITPLSINGLNGLFRVGNGNSTTRSDAMTVLWSGETTVTNKEWKIATIAAPGNASVAVADPASTTDSGGNALVVDGHAVFKGKVVIAVPQGDISMGIYGN